MIADIQFTKNFSLLQMLHSDTATRNHYEEQWQPTQEIINNLRELAVRTLQPLHDYLMHEWFITCAYRCPRTNTAVGGANTSQHLLGQASDNVLTINGRNENLLLAQAVLKSGVPFDQLLIEGGTLLLPSWIHLSNSPRNRRQVLYADFSSGKAVYSSLTPAQVLNAKHG